MALYLDSADVADARAAAELGFVWGITTNPASLAKVDRPPAEVVAELCELVPGTVFYQLMADTPEERADEARRVTALRPGRIGLKIPATPENLALAAGLADTDFPVGITAIFSAAQAYLACQVGADFVLPYVSRSTRLLGDGPALVAEMRAVIEACRVPTEIIAASVKTPEEAVATVLAGAHHLTLPLAVIEALGAHDLSVAAIEDFGRAARRGAGGRSD